MRKNKWYFWELMLLLIEIDNFQQYIFEPLHWYECSYTGILIKDLSIDYNDNCVFHDYNSIKIYCQAFEIQETQEKYLRNRTLNKIDTNKGLKPVFFILVQ